MSDKILLDALDVSIGFASLGLPSGGEPLPVPVLTKIKLMETHPVLPWAVHADNHDHLSVWDLGTKQCMMNEALAEVARRCYRVKQQQQHAVGVSVSMSLQQPAVGNAFKPNNGSKATAMVTEGLKQELNVLTAMLAGNAAASTSSSSSSTSNPSSLTSQQQTAVLSAAAASNDDGKLSTQSIRRITFVDALAVDCATQRPTTPMHRQYAAVASSTTLTHSYVNVHSEGKILIVCESCLLIYDLKSRSGHMITSADLSAAQTQSSTTAASSSSVIQFTYAEFAFYGLLAIGCSDGIVRLWDVSSSQSQAWTQVKTLEGHARGDIVLLKNLASTRPPVDTSAADADDPPMFIRLLSIGNDGNALIWENEVIGNIVTGNGQKPSAKLDGNFGNASASLLGSTYSSSGSAASIGGNSNVFVDLDTMSLAIVKADRTVGIWSLGELNRVSTSRPNTASATSLSRPSNRRSTFMFTNDQQFTDATTLKRVRKIKPGAQFPSALQRYTSCAPFYHPRYALCSTFVVAAKTGSIAIAQTANSLPGDEGSERSSVQLQGEGSGSASERLQPLHEISVSLLLERYLDNSNGLRNTPDKTMTALKSAVNESNLKVNSVQTHKLLPKHVVLSTNVGIVMLEVGSSHAGQAIGRHPLWDNNLALFHSPGSVSKSRVALTPTASPVATHPSSSSSSSCVLAETQPVEDDHVTIDLDSGVPGTSLVASPTGLSLNFNTLLSGQRTRMLQTTTSSNQEPISPVNLSYRIGSTRPVFHVSGSGRYCAVFWPENLHYKLYRVNINLSKDSDGSSRFNKAMVEVERGLCQCFAWVGGCHENSDDIFVTKTPTRKGLASALQGDANNRASRRMSMNLFAAKQEAKTVYRQASLVFKRLSLSSNTPAIIQVNNAETELPGDSVMELFSGPLLGCNVLLQSVYNYINKAVTAHNNLGSSEESPAASQSSMWPEEFYSRRFSWMNQKTKFYALVPMAPTAADSAGYKLVAVGPAIPCVRQVSWDLTSGYCAVVTTGSMTSADGDNNSSSNAQITVLRLKQVVKTTTVQSTAAHGRTKAGKAAALAQQQHVEPPVVTTSLVWMFQTIQNLPIAVSCPLAVPHSLTWHRGLLFVSSAIATTVLCTHYPYRSQRPSLTPANKNVDGTFTYDETVDVIELASHIQLLSDPSRYGSPSAYRVGGPMEMIGVHQGQVLLSSSDGSCCQVIPLANHPLLSVAFLLTLGRPQVSTIVRHIFESPHGKLTLPQQQQCVAMLMTRGIVLELLPALAVFPFRGSMEVQTYSSVLLQEIGAYMRSRGIQEFEGISLVSLQDFLRASIAVHGQ